MIKHTLEGLSIQPSPPRLDGTPRAPVVHLQDGLVLDDRVFECPTLLLGSVGSGKSALLSEIMTPILKEAERCGDNIIIFCAKDEYLKKYRRPQDPVISVDTSDPKSCWNIFKELKNSRNPSLTARDIAKSLTKDQRSELQPFFENASNEFLYNSIMCMYDDSVSKGVEYTNWHLVDFINGTTIQGGGDRPSWSELAKLRPQYFRSTTDYLGNNLGQGYGIISELRTFIHSCMWGSFCSDKGKFSAIETLKSAGNRIFLYYDYANASEARVKIFSTILNLLLKHSVDRRDDGRRTWFFIDEGSLLPATVLADAMSLGRGHGFRVFMCLQTAQLMTRHYKKDEAQTLLSLFPNVLCLKVQDSMSRKVISDRYGEALCSYSFTGPGQKLVQHSEHCPVVADYDFSAMLQKKGDALCSFPNLASSPFFYHGYRKELE